MSSAPSSVTALEQGRAYVDLSSWWKVTVRGGDAEGWLNDLLTAELGGIRPGEARRSMLLTPKGRVRALVTVASFEDGVLLIQDPIQPARVDGLLAPYVLSSDVHLADRTEELGLIAFPGGAPAGVAGATVSSPSVLGPGADVIFPRGTSTEDALDGLVEAGLEDAEAWRVRRGVARFGVDLTSDSLPHEMEAGDLIAYGKGCFLGQEAVAKVRNLGHPPFVLLGGDAAGPVSAGETVLADEAEAGTVTSAVPDDAGGSRMIARVRWALKDASLRTASGAELKPRGLASAA